MEKKIANTSSNLLEKVQIHLPITAEVLNISVDIIPPSTLNNIFKKPEELLNKDGSITKAVSFEPNT